MKIAEALRIANERDHVPHAPYKARATSKPLLKLSERKLTAGNDCIRLSELNILKVLTSKPMPLMMISHLSDYHYNTCGRSLQRLVAKGLAQEYFNGYKYFYSLPLANGSHFGQWCHVDKNRFCQEPGPCEQCCIYEGAMLDETKNTGEVTVNDGRIN